MAELIQNNFELVELGSRVFPEKSNPTDSGVKKVLECQRLREYEEDFGDYIITSKDNVEKYRAKRKFKITQRFNEEKNLACQQCCLY